MYHRCLGVSVSARCVNVSFIHHRCLEEEGGRMLERRTTRRLFGVGSESDSKGHDPSIEVGVRASDGPVDGRWMWA